HHSDSQISSFWDGEHGKYRHYFKVSQREDGWFLDPEVVLAPNIMDDPAELLNRAVAMIETKRLDDPWPSPMRVVMARDRRDPVGMDLYTNSATKYDRAPGTYLAFPTPYYH